jgi:hypothetical protein
MIHNASVASFRMLALAAIVLAAGVSGCSRPDEGPRTQPAPEKPAATRPAPTVNGEFPAEPAPATEPASVPPPSTYEDRPPYPVYLYVRDPEEKQPGWLRVEALADTAQPAFATGLFPEKNRILVDTRNVRRIGIRISDLPLTERKRIVLQIDGQGMELARKDRTWVHLERSEAGIWGSAQSD